MNKILLCSILVISGFLASAQIEKTDKPSECINKWGADSIETQKKLSMFNQYYQEKKFVKAFPYWYYLYVNAPCVQKRITFNGPFIIKKALRDSMYKARFGGLVDTLFEVHYKRIDFFGQEGYVLGKLANDMAKLTPKRRADALKLFARSIELEGMKTNYAVPKNYIYAGVKEYKKQRLSLDSLFMILDVVTPIIDENISKYTAPGLSRKDSIKGSKWIATQEAVINMLKPYLDCDKLVELKKPRYEDNKANPVWLKSTIKLLGRGKCEGEEFYLKCSEVLFTLEPSSEAALSLAKAFNKKGDNAKAVSYYLKGADLATDDKTKYGVYLKLAKSSKNAKNYQSIREYARKALAINPNSGEAYILIGDAYALSASSCANGKLGRSGVYLAAVDKYIKARNVDPSVTENANKQISNYSKYFPGKEDAFFLGLNNGDSYTVGCWIGETTAIRTIGG